MKKTLLLSVLFILLTGCNIFFASLNNRGCVYYEEDGLYYNGITNEPCTSLNKKIERERKKIEKENKKFEKDGK